MAEDLRVLIDAVAELDRAHWSSLEGGGRGRRHYVRREHVPFLGNRMRTFEEFVGHRYSFAALAEEVHCGTSTVQGIVYEEARAILRGEAIKDILFGEAFPPLTREVFERIAAKAHKKFDYPRAVGFMDGKHINVKKLAHSGAMYYNYKRTHSIILLVLADCDYRILAFDVGAPGRVGNAGVYRRSNIKVSKE
ncbi:hypothetical protein V3C99_001926 [Haemonchus contortus]